MGSGRPQGPVDDLSTSEMVITNQAAEGTIQQSAQGAEKQFAGAAQPTAGRKRKSSPEVTVEEAEGTPARKGGDTKPQMSHSTEPCRLTGPKAPATPGHEAATSEKDDDDKALSITSILKSSSDSCEGLAPEAHLARPGTSSRPESRGGDSQRSPRPSTREA